MNKGMTGLIVAGILVALALYGGALLLALSVIALVLMIIGIVKFEGRPSNIVSIIALLAIVVFSGVIPSTWGEEVTTVPIPTASFVESPIQVQEGAVGSASLKLYVKNIAGTYDGTSTIYAIKPGIVTDRNELMKLIYDGKTSDLIPGTMSQSGGTYTLNGYNARIGDTVMFAGYEDSAPAATDNVSFVKMATITGITAGSTPEYMISDSSYIWYNYPTLLFYDSSDAAKTVYKEGEGTAIEKTFTVYMFPTNNGETWKDAALWIESPESSIANIKRVRITSTQGAVDFGMPYEISSVETKFKAQPALTTTTNKMYYVGEIPDVVRTSTSQKAKVTFEVTYDHPASGDVLNYLKVTQNTNALTSAGGHFDSPAVPGFTLNMTATGTDAWS